MMDTLKTVGVSAVVALFVVFGLSFFQKDSGSIGYQNIPGISMAPVSVTTFTQGGGIYATSTSGSAATLLSSSIDEENFVEMTLTNQDATLTLPATSTMTNIAPNAGDTRTIWIRNATTTAGIDLTVAVGTGMTLKNAASSTVLLIGDTDGDNTMRVDFLRKSDGDFNVYMMKYQD